MLDRIKRYCEIAAHAKKDPSLIPNHKNGIVKPMQDELAELINLKELLKDEPDQKKFVEELSADIAILEEALSVYEEKPTLRKRLARYKGKYWYLEDHKDYRGHVSLVDIKDSSAGCNAPPDKVREIIGEEHDKQIKAIEYFQVAHLEAFS